MIKLDAVINDKKLLASIQKGVDKFNRSTAGRSKLNLKINEKGFRQPLGRITGDLDKFESALAASNARVIAFGASTAVIGGVTKAFKELAATTINVQKQFADINRILNVSNKEFEGFSNNLFNIGKKTATTFDDAAKAALEFARQGLGMNETLKRTSDALTLVRLTGVNAEKAVSSLTATVNAFQASSLTTTQALNKFVAVETKFAVSAKDLMEGLGRVGSAAVDAKVDFDQLNAMIAAVQQQTGRGGAVIGNALKTIFTRLQRRDTLSALESFNVQVQDIEGNILPAMNILQNFAKTYKTLSDANKGYLREQVAGVFQANILSALVKDINSDYQVLGRALTTSAQATDEAASANARLNQTISALISQTGTELIRLQENIGKVTFEPMARAILGPFKHIVESINQLLDGEGIGSEFANGLLKGIRNIIAGPGLVAAIAVIGKIFITTASYITKAIPTLVGITTETQKQANLQAQIEAMLASDVGLTRLIAQNEGNAAVQAGLVAAAAKAAEKAHRASATATSQIATNLRLAGMTTSSAGTIVAGKGRRGARGYVPGFAGEAADVRKGVGGVSSSARPVHIPNFAFGGGQHGSMVANTGEYMVPNFSGGGSAIFNPAMVRANGGLPQGAKRITAAQGYVPNFAPLSAQPPMYQKGLAKLKSGDIAGVNTQAEMLAKAGHTNLAGRLTAGIAAKKAQKAKGQSTKGPMQFTMPAKDIKIGAIVGMKSGGKTGYNPSSGFGVIGKEGKIANKGLAQLVRSPAFQGAKFQIKNIPVGAINTIGKGTEKKSAEDVLKEKFTSQMNDIMVPALGKYSSSIFSELFKDDGKAFAQTLTNTRGKRVFSTSVEGGIMESALQFAGQEGSKFGGDDSARWDFEESGKISKPLLDTFFKGKTTQVDRADAKRSDSAPNIKSLIGKSFGTALTANRIARYGPIATAIKGLTAKKAAAGYIPNFAGGGLGAAIGREKAAGIPSSAIRINSSPRFQSPWNPAGLAVTNKMDEPRGLRDVPNFADPDIMGRSLSTGRLSEFDRYMRSMGGPSTGMAKLNTALTGAADDWANNKLKTGEFTDKVKKITGTLGISEQEQRKILQETKKYGKAIRPGSGMGGMMAMMAVPMVAGGVEQAVGGRTGAAISGTATGGMMGGIMGGAALGSILPVWGTVIGAVVGGLAGLATSLAATAETASQVATALQAMQAETERNLKGGAGVIAATEQIKEAATLEDLNSATQKAAEALRGIADVQLRDHLEGAGTDINKMREVMNAFSKEQAQQMQLMGMKRSMMGLQENEILGEEMEALNKAGKTGKGSRYQAIGKAAFGGMRDVFMTAGGTGDKPLGIDKVQGFVDKMTGDAEGFASTFLAGDWTDADIYKNLQSTFADTNGNLLEGVTDGYLMDLAKAIESGLDPDNWPNDAEEEVYTFFQKHFVPMYAEAIRNKNKNLAELTARQATAGNYTQAWQRLLKQVNNTILGYTEDLIKMAEETAVRKATLSARQGFLSFKGGAANATEQRRAGAADIAGRRRGLDKSLFQANQASIMSMLKKVFKDETSLGRDAKQSILYGPQGFIGGGFQSGIETMRGLTPGAGQDQASYITLLKTLEKAFQEGNAVIDKDEKVQQIKMKALELRARIVEEEHKNAVSQAENIHAIRMNLGREKGDTSMNIARIKRSVEAPGALNFLTSAQRLDRTQGADTAVFNEERQLREKEAIASAKEKLIEIQNQANVQKMTLQLVESNFDLKKSIDILNTTMSSPRPVAATGAVGGDGATEDAAGHATTTSARAAAIKKARESGIPGFGLTPREQMLEALKADVAKKRKALPRVTPLDKYNRGDIVRGATGTPEEVAADPLGVAPVVRKEGTTTSRPEFTQFQHLTEEQLQRGIKTTLGQEGPFVERLKKWVKQTEARTAAEKEFAGIEARIKIIEKDLAKNTLPPHKTALPADSFKTSFTNSVSTEKGVGFPGVVPEAKALTSLQGLTAEQAETIAVFNERQTTAFKEGRLEQEKTIQLAAKGIRFGYISAAQADERNLKLMKTEQGWKRVDDIRSKSFKAGVSDSFTQIQSEQEGIFNRLGNELPMQFKNNMVGAIGAAMDKTESLGDALDGVALAFLTTMRNAFLDSAVSNMMNVGKTLWTGSQRGGFIAAQNGTFVGGNSTGDRHPALLESGEYVLNRNAVGALGGPEALNSINFGMAPRFQKGGGHLMALSEKLPSSRMSGLFLQQGNPEYNEIADKAQERMQKAQEKHAKKEQKKAMILSTIISGVMAAGAGWAGSKWGNKPPAGTTQGFNQYGQAVSIAPGGIQRGGFIGRQAGGSIGGSVARRYGLFQGGGTVPVSSGAPSLGGSTNTNNISINIGLGGDNESPGSGASQTATGNTGAPSKANTADAKALSQKIKSQVLKILTEEQRVGGILSPSARRP